ncbi:MAG TPA: sulfotransferase [Anaerolineales bacterium]|nr:sulfotransferase [Anaerolineales bacterium]
MSELPSDSSSIHPIFIVGYMHSGTTLLLDILSRHSKIFASKGETKFFEILPMIKHSFPDLNDPTIKKNFLIYCLHNILLGDQIFLEQPISQDTILPKVEFSDLFQKLQPFTDYALIYTFVFEYLAKRAGKTYWLEKTPTHIFAIDQIIKYAPTTSFIEVVRDPRAVLASKKVRRASVWTDRYTETQRPIKNFEKAYDPLWDTISWKSAIRAGLRAGRHYPHSIFHVRYEDLVTEKEATLHKVCEFLALPYEPTILDVSTGNTAYVSEKDFMGISDKFVSRWKNELVSGEINFPQLVARSEMQIHGYPMVATSFSSWMLSIGYFFKSLLEFFVRLYRRYRLGGTQYLKTVIKNYQSRFKQLFLLLLVISVYI